ncbi:secreted protein, putative, partial [Ixodes scapularis]
IFSQGFLTTAKVTCQPLYHGGYGGTGGANVKQKWSFNPYSNHCEPVMVRSRCPPSQNCFSSKDYCEENCGKHHLLYQNSWHISVIYNARI